MVRIQQLGLHLFTYLHIEQLITLCTLSIAYPFIIIISLPTSYPSPPPLQTDRRPDIEDERPSKKSKECADEECSICYEHCSDFQSCENGHPTCATCFVKWHQRCFNSDEDTTCPTCRETFVFTTINSEGLKLNEFLIPEANRFLVSEVNLESNSIGMWSRFNLMPCLKRLRLAFGMSLAVGRIPPGTFSNLLMLSELNLAGNALKEIRREIFSGTPNLQYLNLHNTWLTAIPGDVFDDLKSLNTLRLSNNQLKTLPANVFDKLNALRDLYLQNNYLEVLPNSQFVGLSSLTTLDVSHNELKEVQVGSFAGLSKLKYLYMDQNWIPELPLGIFDSLVRLRELELGSCLRLTGLPDGLFSKLENLERLQLCNARFKTLSITRRTLQGLNNLTLLYFLGNDLDLQADCLNDLSNLEEIFLQCNSLKTLPVGLFDGLHKVQSLCLCNNMIKRLEVGVFDDLPNLVKLDLKSNWLQNLPERIFEKLVNLQSLDLSFNPLETFSVDYFDGLRRLRYCNLPGLKPSVERDIRALVRTNKRK